MKTRNLLMKIGTITLSVVFCALDSALAQDAWPLIVESGNRTVHVYKPEIENYNIDKLSFRAAMSVVEGDDSPVFGSMWADADLTLNSKERTVEIRKVSINELRFPDGFSTTRENDLNKLITSEMSRRRPKVKMDDILADLDNAKNSTTSLENLNNIPPEIIYADKPSILVTIDGDPIVQATETTGVDMIVNTPFLILKYKNVFYLGNGSLWYKSASPLSGWAPYKNLPKEVLDVAKSLRTDSESFAEQTDYPAIAVTTKPAELIQTDGVPQYSPIKGTSLNYVNNTEDEILFDINEQLYYVLLSGRWYRAAKLTGPWEYAANENLPADFEKIPEGSDKDAVLASVPGTKASFDAVREAQVPQAAVVDRQTATTDVVYDGEPRFEPIDGTEMRYASNSSNTVIVERNRYYVVDNGVWFVGHSPAGPWTVSDSRPVQINVIPPSCPVYNVRYVNIYYATPQVVYVGYTRGYLSSYVTGRVVVYGTGYHYRPWRGRYYYPRPCTWGFGMNYNPWSGWSVNFCYGASWFVYSYPPAYYGPHYRHSRYNYRTGWWGPPVYRPPYRVPYTHCYGPHRAVVRNSCYRSVRVIPDRVHTSTRRNNIYASNYERRGVVPVRASSATMRASAQNSGRASYSANYGRSAQPATVRAGSTQEYARGSASGTRGSSSYNSRSSSGTSSRYSSGTSTRPSGSSTGTRENGSTSRPSSGISTRQRTDGTSSRNPSGSSSYAPSTNSRPSSSGTSTRPSGSSTGTRENGSTSRPSSETSTQQRTGGTSSRNPSGSSGSASNTSSRSSSGTVTRPSNSSSNNSRSPSNKSGSSSRER